MIVRNLFVLLVMALAFAAAGTEDSTALHRAAYADDLESVRALIRAGADAKAPNPYGITPLALACSNGNAQMVLLLLDAGADANAALPGGETPLMTAARTGNVEVVRTLLSRGADVHSQLGETGQTALMWASAEGHVETVEALLQAGATLNDSLDSGYTPFLFAVREGKLDVVRTLLKAGANINAPVRPRKSSGPRPASGAGWPREGTTALHIAVVNGHFELASFLIDQGANLNNTDVGYAPLHAVTWVRKPGGGDNDPSPVGSGGMTSLDFVRKVAASGGDLNVRMTKKMNVGLTNLNTKGATAFMLAARSADAELMRLLVELGADPLLANDDNSTPLMVAAGLGTRSPGEDAGTESEVLEAVKLALELGGDINAVDDNGETAMHGAAYKNLPEVVRLLGASGAKPEIWYQKNKRGWTPLTIAEGYRFGNFKPSLVTVAAITEVLTAAGIRPVLTTGSGSLSNSDYKKQ
jgi:ankyrin repeat protein